MSYINYISINLEKYVNMIKLSSTWVKKKKCSLDYITPQLWLYLFSPILSQISWKSCLLSQQSDFNSHNSTKWPHNYTKWIFAKVINILVPKSSRCFHHLSYLTFWYHCKMLATCSFIKHSSICFCGTFFFWFSYYIHNFSMSLPPQPVPLPWNGLSHLYPYLSVQCYPLVI